ncbi:MAG: haloalkane dehalogenase [Gammaproteobacteria bacterium TMED95]|nr:haloalkane dehalogenase [Gammaproteobacteria bacterium]OUV21460.1 MAG: haloalkane dehalogenase [Gammaproteobacteria bacterium TMED95]
MQILRTPDDRFEQLKDYPFAPHYTQVNTEDGSPLRIHHLDEGPKNGNLVLLMHGQPVWSYLYRKMVPYLTGAGLRVIAPDLPGYGKSDKPAAREHYSYEHQVDWMGQWLEANDFRGITFFGQDWGGLIGLRLVAQFDDRFDRVVIANTGLPYNPDTTEETLRAIETFRSESPTPSLIEMQQAISKMPSGDPARQFAYWQKFCWETVDLPVGLMMQMTIEQPALPVMAFNFVMNQMGLFQYSPLRSSLAKAYEAPFPGPEFKMGVRAMPSHVPTTSASASLSQQAAAWDFFERFEKPFLCTFSDNDPVTKGLEHSFLGRVPGTKGLKHHTIKGGGHFVQEAAPELVCAAIQDLIATT